MKKIISIILVLMLMVSNCYGATQLKKTVKPDGTGDYTTLEACMNANEQNLVTADKYFDVEIDGDWSGGADTTAVTVHNYTTDATRYINIYTTSTARHKGKYSTDYYILSAGDNTLTCNAQFIRITGLQLDRASTTSQWLPTFQFSVSTATGDIQISSNIIRTILGTQQQGTYGMYIQGSAWISWYPKIWNNIIYGFKATVGAGINCGTNTGATNAASIYNNTIYNCTQGIQLQTTCILKNNIINDCTTDYSTTADANSTYNITNDTPSASICFGVTADSGTTDNAAANKLKDSDQNFLTTCKVGMIIKNTTDTTYTYITAVDSDGQLSVNNDIFANGENYTIYTNMYGNVAFINETAGSEDLHLQSSDTVAKDKGANLYADTPAITTDIDGENRPNSSTTFDIGADEYIAPATGGMAQLIYVNIQ